MGLTNNQNVCYANVIVQCMRACPSLVSHDGKHDVFALLKKDIVHETHDATGVVTAVSEKHKSIVLGDTNDASEFYMLLVDDLCEEDASLKKLFYGSSTVRIECHQCKFTESTKQELGVITLSRHAGASLSEALHEAFAAESVERTCEKCKGTCASKQVHIVELPPILTIVQNERRNRMQVESILGIVRDGNKQRYELVGAIVHSANHYLCVVKPGPAEEFFACNDNQIQSVPRDALLKAASMASMLFFHLMEGS